MSTPILFISPGACSLGSQVMLEFLKIPYQVCITNAQLRQTPGFRQINPQGKVGALKDGNLSVAENAAILFHLSDHYGVANSSTSFTLKSTERTKAYQWLSYLGSTLHVAFGQALFVKVDPEILEKYQANACAKLLDVLKFVNDFLTDNDYFVGNKLSFIDGQAYGLLRWARLDMARQASIEINNFPQIVKFLQRMEQLQEVQNALAIESNNPDKVTNSKFNGYFELGNS